MPALPAQREGAGFVLPVDAVEVEYAREFVLRIVGERLRNFVRGRSGYRDASPRLRDGRASAFLVGGLLTVLRSCFPGGSLAGAATWRNRCDSNGLSIGRTRQRSTREAGP